MKYLDEYISFDLEFNTVDKVRHILQVSAVKYQNGKEVGQFDSFVHSEVSIKSFITGLTGITPATIRQAPPLEEVLQQFQAFIQDTPLIGYNAIKSDVPLLQEKGFDVSEQYAFDIYHLVREKRHVYFNGISQLSLKAVADYLKIKGRGHNSLEDARMTALVYEQLMDYERNKDYLVEHTQEVIVNNPFASLGLADLFESDN
ncbi:3'-5' exonuclease [Aerococcaceae bacterium NML180378]|nr:3'-5' exonuclease [Aerococcaceae bacterium NML180378]